MADMADTKEKIPISILYNREKALKIPAHNNQMFFLFLIKVIINSNTDSPNPIRIPPQRQDQNG
jgi:hypothetical protein